MALFYADAILSKKGPLARVWLAAHYERKLSKAQTLQTDIGQSAKAIESRPLALRISGQLLLGVCRIYSRKAKYLLDDCNEALVKIKLAFRPGVVDMTDEQLAVPANAITLQGEGFNLDLFGDTWDFDQTRKTGGKHLARETDINLPMQEDFLMTIDGDKDWNMDDMDGGFGDLDLNFGDQPFNLDDATLNEDSMAVEMARDAAPARSARESLASNLQLKGNEGDLSLPNGDERNDFGDMDLDMGDVGELNLDFGDILGNPDITQTQNGQSEGGSRRSSPLTEPAPATPKDAADEDTPVKKVAKKRKPKERKQVIDSVTEQNGANFSKSDVSNIITTHPYLSNSIAVMRFQDVLADPLAHFFPAKVTEEGSFICLAPPGMAPELQDLFLFPIKEGAGQKRKGREQGERASKRPRLDGEDVDEVELLRERASVPFSPGHGDGDAFGVDGFQDESGFLPNDSFPVDDFRFEVDDSLHVDKMASSRAQTPGDDLFVGGLGGDEDSRIRMFDTQQTQESQLFSQSQQRDREEAEEEKEKEEANKDGYSRNTVKAIEVLRDELENLPQGKETLSFAKLTDKASRRAASSFFFELLVLGTRDCVKLNQTKAFGDIKVQGKDKLWQGKIQDEKLVQ